MVRCRCEVLNVMSGDVAKDYRVAHLLQRGLDGMGRRILGCGETDIEWIEERQAIGYGADVSVLRRRWN